jgi:type IV secretory pathway TrbL component
MKSSLLAVIFLAVSFHAESQVGVVPKIIRGAEAGADASKASRVAKAGSKVVSAEAATAAMHGSESMISAQTKTLIAARSAQIMNNCTNSRSISNKENSCERKSNEFQRCISSEISTTGLVAASVDRCYNLFK